MTLVSATPQVGSTLAKMQALAKARAQGRALPYAVHSVISLQVKASSTSIPASHRTSMYNLVDCSLKVRLPHSCSHSRTPCMHASCIVRTCITATALAGLYAWQAGRAPTYLGNS